MTGGIQSQIIVTTFVRRRQFAFRSAAFEQRAVTPMHVLHAYLDVGVPGAIRPSKRRLEFLCLSTVLTPSGSCTMMQVQGLEEP
jgi:hypothetical protein